MLGFRSFFFVNSRSICVQCHRLTYSLVPKHESVMNNRSVEAAV